MSKELNYSPPSGTKYKWSDKALNHSAWLCSGDLNSMLGSARMAVDLVDGEYKWGLDVWVPFCKRSTLDPYNDYWSGHMRVGSAGSADSALAACLKAEEVYRDICKYYIKPWMKTAIKNGWRTPATRGRGMEVEWDHAEKKPSHIVSFATNS